MNSSATCLFIALIIYYFTVLGDTQTPSMFSSSKTTNNLLLFLQVTDIHLSAYQDHSRAQDLIRLFRRVVSVINPEVVFVTGDLTDSKSKSGLASSQILSEWQNYKEIIESSGILNSTILLDIRGNHDMFGVLDVNEGKDYFSTYAVQGKRNHSSYALTIKKPFGNYSFIVADTCPRKGLRFPLNFFGHVHKELGEHLQNLAESTALSNQTFWFGHYPTSTIISPLFDFRNLLGKSAFAYFCGHLHTAARLVRQMYTVHSEGFIELELGDWRAERYYRIVAVDNDLVSFADYQFPNSDHSPGEAEWPIVLVTNPKDANFLLPNKEPVERIRTSSHIRILAWSQGLVTNVSVWINDMYLGAAIRSSLYKPTGRPSPLFTLPWNPSLLTETPSHQLRVEVTDSVGNKRIVTQSFSVRGIPTRHFSLLSQWTLRSYHTLNLIVVFYLSCLFVFVFVMVPNFIPDKLSRTCRQKSDFYRRLYRFSRTPSLLCPVVTFLVYELCGPIFIGFVIPDHLGVVFSFGIVVAGDLVLEPLTYIFELLQLWSFFLFLTVSTIRSCESRRKQTRRSVIICTMLFSVLQTLFLLLTVAIPYGLVAVVLSPGRLFPLGLAWYLAHQVRSLP